MGKMMKRHLGMAVTIGLGLLAGMPAWAASGTRTTSFAYDPASGLLTQEVIEPGNAALRLQTDTTYDSYGNKVAVTVSGADIASRTSTATFNSRGRFNIGASNALGHSETTGNDARFGLVTTQTGPNGLTSTWEYDEFGRKVLEVRPDGMRTKWQYAYCSGVAGGTAACPAGGAYLITMTPLAADGTTQNGPQAKEYRDKLGRPIAGETQGFDGSTVRQDTVYDAMGRVKQTSRPYFLSGGTPRWTLRDYDILGRVIKETAPDGSISTIAYDALVTTVTNALGQVTRTVKNAQGLVTSVTDAAGQTITTLYDSFGNPTRITDPAGNVVTYGYDQRGRKVTASDPDLGAWSYAYDVLGQMVSQTDAKGQTTTLTYDKLGRMTGRSDGGASATWTWDSAVKGVGKIAASSTSEGVARSFAYDALGRPSQATVTVDGASYSHGVTYDAQGRIDTMTSPSGLELKHGYTALGHLRQVSNAATTWVYWTANTRDAEGHLLSQTAGNGVVTTQVFDPNTGAIQTLKAGPADAVANFSYAFDTLGNLTSRGDVTQSLAESFGHDSLNRLTSAAIAGGVAKTVSYDAVGNITAKSDVGTYAYPTPGQARPHAVLSVTGALTASYSYDANGNLLSGAGRSVTWTAFNMPATIAQGAASLSFSYDAERNRVKKVSTSGTQLYLDGPGLRTERLTGAGGVVTWTDYLPAGGETIGQRVSRSDGQSWVRYYTKDHLGSIAVITDETGAVAERLSYDPWGKRRNPNGTDDAAGALTSQVSRGFTGHEMLDDVDLVHMNGRVYDPQIGRFLSADPIVKYPASTQGWNRYAYVDNNPLARVDPSGYGWFSKFTRVLVSPFGLMSAIPAFNKIETAVFRNQFAASALMMSSAFCGPFAAACAAQNAAYLSNVRGGGLGDMIKAAAISYITARAFEAVGTATNSHFGPNGPPPGYAMSGDHIANIIGHAAVGCASSAAQGGSCGSGALAAGFGSAAGPVLPNLGTAGNLVTHAVVGGVGSVLGGGKFENGAVTSAFGYMFNNMGKPECTEGPCTKPGGGRGATEDLGGAFGKDAVPIDRGNGDFLNSNPLRGTRAGTLDIKWNDRAFYDQLQTSKEWAKGAPQPQTTTQKVFETVRTFFKAFTGSSD